MILSKWGDGFWLTAVRDRRVRYHGRELAENGKGED